MAFFSIFAFQCEVGWERDEKDTKERMGKGRVFTSELAASFVFTAGLVADAPLFGVVYFINPTRWPFVLLVQGFQLYKSLHCLLLSSLGAHERKSKGTEEREQYIFIPNIRHTLLSLIPVFERSFTSASRVEFAGSFFCFALFLRSVK